MVKCFHLSPLGRRVWRVLLVALLTLPALCRAEFVDALDPRITYLGAWMTDGATRYTIYPGSQIRIRLQGKATLSFLQYSKPTIKLKIRALGANGGLVRKDSDIITLVSSNAPGEFEVNFMGHDGAKTFDTGEPKLIFQGVNLEDGSALFEATAPRGRHRLDFLGDSITQGIRILRGTGGVDAQDATASFGFVAARIKQCPYRIRAQSGIGLRTFWLMIAQYQKDVPLPPEPDPDYVLINIGANNQSWDNASFRMGLEQALEQVRIRFPGAYIVMLNFFNNSGRRSSAINAALANTAPGQGHLFDARKSIRGYTDGIHPNTSSHDRLGKAIAAHLNQAPVPADFDGDGLADPATYWSMNGNWSLWLSDTQSGSTQNWGYAGTKPFTGFFDADNIADRAVYDPSLRRWFIAQSQDGDRLVDWGVKNGVPLVGDFDGDGLADLASYSSSKKSWYVLQSQNGPVTNKFRESGATPVIGDFDADGKDDMAFYYAKKGTWTIRHSSSNVVAVTNWGFKSTIPVPADYDNDGTTDLAVYHPATGNWYVRASTDGDSLVQWGFPGAVPVPADYDGDGRADIAVYWPEVGVWYIKESQSGNNVEIVW